MYGFDASLAIFCVGAADDGNRRGLCSGIEFRGAWYDLAGVKSFDAAGGEQVGGKPGADVVLGQWPERDEYCLRACAFGG